MSTSIASGKRLALVLVAAATLMSAQGQNISFDFENEEPGTFPKGLFEDTWGTLQNGVYVYTCNTVGCNSQQSLMINALPNQGFTGLMLNLWPKGMTRGVVELEFDYMREGFGEIRFELRPKNEIWPFMRIEENSFLVYRGNGWYGKTRAEEMPFEPGVWYHFKVTFPLTKQDGDVAKVVMKDLKSGKEFHEQWDDTTFPKQPGEGGVLYFLKQNLTGSVHHEYIDNFKRTLKR